MTGYISDGEQPSFDIVINGEHFPGFSTEQAYQVCKACCHIHRQIDTCVIEYRRS